MIGQIMYQLLKTKFCFSSSKQSTEEAKEIERTWDNRAWFCMKIVLFTERS